NCSYKYSRDDLMKIKKEFKGKGIVEFMFDNGESAEEIVDGYEKIAGTLAPDVAAIPLLWFNETWTDEDIKDVYFELRNISEKYSREMRWVE
ncbi:MAG: hypothetical protein KAJ15_10925, partial [Spirochaetes bacterium]|nr:hypothetical protein [Spirochaetota bacterium]